MSGRSDSAHHPAVIRSELAGPLALRRTYLRAHPRASRPIRICWRCNITTPSIQEHCKWCGAPQRPPRRIL